MHKVQYVYPQQVDKYNYITSVEHLRNLLKSQSKVLKINRILFKIIKVNQKYIYAKCFKCTSNLKFKIIQQQNSIKNQQQSQNNSIINKKFKLTYFQNKHEHKLIFSHDHILNFINQLPQKMQNNIKRQICLSKFKINKNQMNYILRKYYRHQKTFKQILKQYSQNKYEIVTYPYPFQDQIPDICFITSQQMKIQFQNNKHHMMFDITYNLIKQTKYQQKMSNNQLDQNQKKLINWGVGFFIGLNSNHKIVPFGLVLTNKQNKLAFKQIFSTFFQILGKPTIISTDQQIAIVSSLEQLKQQQKWNGNHFIDPFHLIKNLKKNIKRQQLVNVLSQAIFTFSPLVYENLINKFKQMDDQNRYSHVLQKFIQKSHKCCYSQISNSNFHGIRLGTSPSQKLNDLIKGMFKYEQKASIFIHRTLIYFKELNSKSKIWKICKTRYEQFYNNYKLKELRNQLAEPIFLQIMKKYGKSVNLLYEEVESLKWIITDSGFNYQVTVKDQKLICQCPYLQKVGLPCEHLIKIIIAIRQNLKNYISSYYIKEEIQDYQDKIFCYPGGPRTCRKNKQY